MNKEKAKPIYELQMLEGPQMKANRLLNNYNPSEKSSINQHLYHGSVYRQGFIERMIDPNYPISTRNMVSPRITSGASSATLEASILQN